VSTEFHLRVRRDAYEAPGLTWADPEPGRPLDEPYRPTNRAPLIRARDPAAPRAGLEGVELRWWLVPAFHKGPAETWKTLCVNARIETLETAPIFRDAYRSRRALVPLTSFVLHDEPPGWSKGQPKRRWEVTWRPAGQADKVRWFAAIWEQAGDLQSFAIVTGPSGPDLIGVDPRQPAVLTLAEGLAWLDLDGPGKAALVTETPAGTYSLTEQPRDALMSRDMRRAL
jgi:putative SOS response-associated peptidase YedK